MRSRATHTASGCRHSRVAAARQLHMEAVKGQPKTGESPATPAGPVFRLKPAEQGRTGQGRTGQAVNAREASAEAGHRNEHARALTRPQQQLMTRASIRYGARRSWPMNQSVNQDAQRIGSIQVVPGHTDTRLASATSMIRSAPPLQPSSFSSAPLGHAPIPIRQSAPGRLGYLPFGGLPYLPA